MRRFAAVNSAACVEERVFHLREGRRDANRYAPTRPFCPGAMTLTAGSALGSASRTSGYRCNVTSAARPSISIELFVYFFFSNYNRKAENRLLDRFRTSPTAQLSLFYFTMFILILLKFSRYCKYKNVTNICLPIISENLLKFMFLCMLLGFHTSLEDTQAGIL